MTEVLTAMTDNEIKTRGFRLLVDALGDVNAERFIMLTIREPMDYTKWRERNMYLDEDLDALAERARRTGAKFEEDRQKRQSATTVAVS